MISGKKARVLIVDDEKMNLRVLADLLKDEYSLVLAKSGEQALKLAFENLPDLILLDVIMPDMGGYEVIKQLREHEETGQVPVIFVTSLNSPEEEEHGLRLGAVDYITKPFSPPIVKMRVRNHLRFMHQFKLLDELVHFDGLTEIPNRRRFDEVFKKEISRADRNGTPFSVAMVDVDFFKQFNDYYGHGTGDNALREVAHALRNSLKRSGDLAARYGGEEFVLVLPETDLAAACTVAERGREAVAGLRIPHLHSKAADHVSVSVGVATKLPGHDPHPENMLKQADKNLYKAKESGRNRVIGSVYEQPMQGTPAPPAADD